MKGFTYWFQISLEFLLEGPIDNKSALVQVIAWPQTGDKPFIIWTNDGIDFLCVYVSLGLDLDELIQLKLSKCVQVQRKTNLFVIHCQGNMCWCSNNMRRQGINRHCIDAANREYSEYYVEHRGRIKGSIFFLSFLPISLSDILPNVSHSPPWRLTYIRHQWTGS